VLQRLHRERDIRRVFREGRRFHSPVAVLHSRRRAEEEGIPAGPRLTVVAGKSFRNAVTRNRARRTLREVSRVLLRDVHQPCDVLVVAPPSALDQPYQARLQTLTDLFGQAGLLAENGGAAA
jgi:ribonuclease P protein component